LFYVQYGCGWSAPRDWLNFDASPTLRLERLPLVGRLIMKNPEPFPSNVRAGNIVDGLPVEDRTCQGVYASHILEHLALDEFHIALDHTRRMLSDGGIFRLLVPDLDAAVREYVQQSDAGVHTANECFLDRTSLGSRSRQKGLQGAAMNFLGNSSHRWMWDAASMDEALRQHGFRMIRQCEFGDCEDSAFESVERRDRFEGAIAFEARA
jgi:hypothetical protein